MNGTTIDVMLQQPEYVGAFTAQGIRSTASTILNEHRVSRDAIEQQLAHIKMDEIRAAYNRADYLPERKRKFNPSRSAWMTLQVGNHQLNR